MHNLYNLVDSAYLPVLRLSGRAIKIVADSAAVAESVDATDSKSVSIFWSGSSSLPRGTVSVINKFGIASFFFPVKLV